MRSTRTRICTVGLFVAAAVVALTTSANAATNDPLYAKQWGLTQINAEQAWAKSTGAGAVIAIVDTGVDLSHPDLQGKLVPGATFVNCPQGQRPCGDGDWRGTDGIGSATDVHGTLVSGVAAAATGNGIGIAGVAPDAKIMPVKVLEDTGTYEDVADGVRWAADHGADVINLSLAGLPNDQLLTMLGLETRLRDAIEYAVNRDIAVVAAAGNFSLPICSDPAFTRNVICVIATDRFELKAWYSQFGLKADLKLVSAPGGLGLPGLCDENVWSTTAQGTGVASCGQPDYDAQSGTSLAAPHVSGVAALLAAQGRGRAEIYHAILSTARTPNVLGLVVRGIYNPVYGFGIVDAAAAVNS
ncbi:S8 family serine peptidase [Nocardia sp. CDC159]|uniref:S8 family serine peptidase n=1 Tax=Nocardia pulmonis TaxID=2951408 RepID=A0A9X2ECJ5_9NOCA|nr:MULTISPECIES: S8 family serine peptidase [Nocardia]MCM6778334.1 S8 family serine peptidase [Nocardia pulmonis]MCM6791270.1 S8 family serine peptidase [Nocardia sp. CDC159]